MSFTDGIQNMGFPEVPDDAFDAFDLPPANPPHLTRTYRAYCPYCGSRSESITPLNRSSPCVRCYYHRIPIMQGLARGFLTRKRYERYRLRDLINRWFITGGCNGGDLSLRISSFV